MKSKWFIIACWFLCINILDANPIDDSASFLVYEGAPISSITFSNQYLIKSNFAIHYRYDTKTAEYVVEHLDRASFTLIAERLNTFRPDEEIPLLFRAMNDDYRVPNIDRGHLSPATDNVFNRTRMNESFLLSNIVPQNSNNNRGIWKMLEGMIRRYIYITHHDLYVISGTYYESNYVRIGRGIGIPTCLWKCIIDPINKKGTAYFIPNKELDPHTLENYRMSINQLESKVKIIFSPKLSSSTNIKTDGNSFLFNTK